MEFYSNEQCFLEELLGLREMECLRNQDLSIPTACCFQNYPPPTDQTPKYSSFYGEVPYLFPPDLAASDSSNIMTNSQTLPYSHHYSMSVFEDDGGADYLFADPDMGQPCKVEPGPGMPSFNVGFGHQSHERSKNKVKKVNGQPSKNLMAERRRRKRLNDRLSMLRSVVPKISKMDRTSILGDTIDYMKELLEKINKLQEDMDLGATDSELLSIFKNVKPEEILNRNAPNFEVVRRNNSETKIEICCAGKPGLLLSTLTTLEALGMDIHHCVISCFNDFAMQASCSEGREQRSVLHSEDIKQALFRNAGYGGRCLSENQSTYH